MKPTTGAAVRALLVLAMPMVLARASQSVITFADAIQVKHLGPGAIAATATGGLNVFGLVILPMGIAFIIQSFVAQLVGAGQREATRRYAWYGLVLAAIAAVVSLAVIPLIGPALALTGYSPHVRDQMTDYMAIRMLSVGAIVGVEALGNWYGGLGNTWMQMIAGIITMIAAIIFNAILIPTMGVAGAAWASVIASWLGFGFVAFAFWRGWGKVPVAEKLELSRAEFRRVLRFGLPNGLNWFFEFAAFQLFVNGVLGSLGDNAVASLNVVIAVNSISFMPAFGLASAGAILAGQAIGRGERADVSRQVKITLGCTMTWMVAIGITYTVLPGPILGLFAEGPNAANLIALGKTMLMMSAAWQVFDATSMTLSETLRAAGDTKWIAIARIIIAWGVFMPSAFILVRYFDGGPIGAMGCLAVYVALLAFALAYRFRSGAWKSIELIEPKLI